MKVRPPTNAIHSVAIAGLTGAQVRGAMGLLGWSVSDLSKESKASESTVSRLTKAGVKSRLVAMMIRMTFERHGISFGLEYGDGIVIESISLVKKTGLTTGDGRESV